MAGGLNPNLNFSQSPLDLATADNSAIIDAINRLGSELDSFNQQLSFTASGELDIAYDGSSGFIANNSLQHSLGYAPIFLVFCKYAGESKWRLCDDLRVASGGLVSAMFTAQSDIQNLTVQLQTFATGVADTAQFKWFLLREPAQ